MGRNNKIMREMEGKWVKWVIRVGGGGGVPRKTAFFSAEIGVWVDLKGWVGWMYGLAYENACEEGKWRW